MILVLLVLIPFGGAFLAWLSGRLGNRWPRWISFSSLAADFLLGLGSWAYYGNRPGPGWWIMETRAEWLPGLGISFHLAADGFSCLLVLLTCFLGLVALASSWKGVADRAGFFHFNLLFCLSGIIGVFLAMDLFLFYFFWEVMLIPMYFIIALWGHERRLFGAIKFLIFTQAGGLLMLAATVALVFINGAVTGFYSFDFTDLLDTPVTKGTGLVLFSGFAAAFLVKLPALPFHPWLPDAHTEAPTAGSIILAGLLLKTGAYGLIRFAIPLFPDAAERFGPVAMLLAVAGILYGAVLAFAQTDLKRLIAYTSISHMGFVLLGITAWNPIALKGVMLQIVCHGLSTGALFMLAGILEERTGTRDMTGMAGFWTAAPRMGGFALFFALASLALPGLGNFVAEFLILLGSFSRSVPFTILASLGMAGAVLYALTFVGRVFFGPSTRAASFPDLSTGEMAVFALLVALLLWIGIFPQTLVATAGPSLDGVIEIREGPDRIRSDLAAVTGPQVAPRQG